MGLVPYRVSFALSRDFHSTTSLAPYGMRYSLGGMNRGLWKASRPGFVTNRTDQRLLVYTRGVTAYIMGGDS